MELEKILKEVERITEYRCPTHVQDGVELQGIIAEEYAWLVSTIHKLVEYRESQTDAIAAAYERYVREIERELAAAKLAPSIAPRGYGD